MTFGTYSLPAIRGRQGQHDYYLIQCPARLLARLFLFNEPDLPPAVRRGRTIDPARVEKITKYIASNAQGYTLAPLLAVVDSAIRFEEARSELPEIGIIHVSMTARMIVCDGQHRRAAIQQLLAKGSAIGDDTISVMLIPDPTLTLAPRLYADFNRYQLQPTLSKRVLHDHSDIAALVRQLVDEIPLFQGRTELEKTTISNRSTALFTLSAVYQATVALLGATKKTEVSLEQFTLAQQFWQRLTGVIPEWRRITRGEVSSAYLRQHYVHSHTVTLLAIGLAAHDLIAAHPDDWSERLQALGELDWAKSNQALWEGRTMVHGKMSKTDNSVKLTATMLKRAMGLQISEQEQALEQRIHRS